jgi:hypothetical protein
MNIHLDEDIKEMLYEGGSVVIPGLGAFRGGYKSAYIDGIQGHLAPPSLEIIFDPNTVINDGVFVDFLRKKYQISIQEAQTAIEDFKEKAFSTFDKHELIVIPQVGRLYRDFNKKVQFLPDSTNFNTDTFGLPTAQFHPVSRTYTEKTAAVEAIMNETPPPPITNQAFPESSDNIPYPTLTEEEPNEGKSGQWRKFMPGLTIAVLVIMTFSIYMHNQNKEKLNPEAEKAKVNVSPQKPAEDAPATSNNPPIASTPPTPQAEKTTIANEKMVEKSPVTEGSNSTLTPPTPVVKSNKVRIICGAFGDINNINRHKKWFAANGYGVYEKPNGAITILGAEVSYSDKQDLRRIVGRLQERFGAAAVKISKK